MPVRSLAASVVPRQMIRRIHESSTLFPAMIRKPRVVTRWLIGAHSAQIALLLVVAFLLFAAPPIRDAILDRAYPPKGVTDKIAGLFRAEDGQSKRRDTSRHIINAITWVSSGGLVILLLWMLIPTRMSRATEKARESERLADSLLVSDPFESLAHYRSAVAWECEAAREAALIDKIREISKEMPTMMAGAEPGNIKSVSVGEQEPAATNRRPSETANRKTDIERVADRYAIVEELGRGANGVVYRADDTVLGRQVALKELPREITDDESLAPRFRQEARVLAQLSHPYIVQVYDFVEDAGRLWIVMELIEGGDLASCLREHGRLSVPAVAILGQRMAEAIASAHESEIVHRDLKPLNVLLVDERTPKITDFGLAKLRNSSMHTMEGAVMGSPHYMSPEQADAKPVDHLSDIYSLGAVLYHMLGGRPPFEGNLSSVLAQHIRRRAVPLRKAFADLDIPLKLDRLVLQMLAKKASERPANMRIVAERLGEFANFNAARAR